MQLDRLLECWIWSIIYALFSHRM